MKRFLILSLLLIFSSLVFADHNWEIDGKFRIMDDGNIAFIRSVPYSWPITGQTGYLNRDGSGNLKFQDVSGGGTPSDTVTGETSFGQSSNAGALTTYSRGDHTHGTPANPVPGHESTYNHLNLPSTDQKNALQGTDGTPSDSNRYVTNLDPRNSDARSPTIHGSSAHTGTIGAWSQIDKTISNISDIATRSHTSLSDIGTNTHTQIDTHISATVSVHGFDASGNAPAQAHGSTKHTGTIGTWAQIDKTTSNISEIATRSHTSLSDIGSNTHAQLDTHLSASAPHSGHLQIGGQIGGTASSPDVRGVRETSGPTLLTLGFISDGQYLQRSGSNVIGVTPTTIGLGYTIRVEALTSSPTDAQTVYFGMLPKTPTTTANISKCYVRKAGTIKIAEIYCYSGTAGTSEAWSLYVRKNNTTDYLIATLSLATSERVFTNSALSIAMAAGDYFEIKGIQPTWATNPLTTIYGGYVYIE